MTTSDIPRSVWQGTFSLYGVEIECHTLEDGQRIIEGRSLERLFDELNDGPVSADITDMDDFLLWYRGPG